jgi:hypothetical protein
MPTCRPETPRFVNSGERQVWQQLTEQLFDDDVVLANVRITDRAKDHEADLVVLLPGAGIVVVEVKAGRVWLDDHGEWQQAHGERVGIIAPVEQAREAKYALRRYIETDHRWGGRKRVRWAHAVVLPHSEVGDGFAAPECPRWLVIDRTELHRLGNRLRGILLDQKSDARGMNTDDCTDILDILAGRGRPQRDVLADVEARNCDAQRLTEEQAVILGAARLLNRIEVRGGAGSGKTWLAVEQARRLTTAGRRVALMCYSRGLASYLRRHFAAMPRNQRPAYVGEFFDLGTQWGADEPEDDLDSDYWERRLPQQMRDLAAQLPVTKRFDAVVIDEAQDFADNWWPAVLAALKDEEDGGLYVFTDEGQRVFARFGQPPVRLVPLVLDHNLRNTRQIAATFNPLTPVRMKPLGGDGPAVRFVDCPTDQAMDAGDDAVDGLFDEGWRAEDIALLTTGSRHIEQVARQEIGQDEYWDTFWDADQVFYGHVLGFKGLERRAVVLVLNEHQARERSRERLYVGLSRARDRLVVCGDSAMIRDIGGEDVLRALRRGEPPTIG